MLLAYSLLMIWCLEGKWVALQLPFGFISRFSLSFFFNLMFLYIGPYSPFFHLKLMSGPIFYSFTVISLTGIMISPFMSWPHQCVGNAQLWVQFLIFDTCMQIVPVTVVLWYYLYLLWVLLPYRLVIFIDNPIQLCCIANFRHRWPHVHVTRI